MLSTVIVIPGVIVPQLTLLPAVIQFKRTFHQIKGLPFSIKRQAANEKLCSSVGYLDTSPTHFNKQKSDTLVISKKDPVQQAFLPFYTADVQNLKTTYVGQYGVDYFETQYQTVLVGKSLLPMPVTTVETRWYPTQGTLEPHNYPCGTLETQVYADFKYPRQIIEKSLNSTDIQKMQELNIKDTHIYPHVMKSEYARKCINSRLFELEEQRASAFVKKNYNADHCKIDRLTLHFGTAPYKLIDYHCPGYILGTSSENFKIMNGCTGKVNGNKKYSSVKIGLLAGAVSLSTIALQLLGGPVLSGIQMVGILLGSGMVAAVVTKLCNFYRQNKAQKLQTTEFKENELLTDTQEDADRRLLPQKNNQQN